MSHGEEKLRSQINIPFRINGSKREWPQSLTKIGQSRFFLRLLRKLHCFLSPKVRKPNYVSILKIDVWIKILWPTEWCDFMSFLIKSSVKINYEYTKSMYFYYLFYLSKLVLSNRKWTLIPNEVFLLKWKLVLHVIFEIWSLESLIMRTFLTSLNTQC